MSFILAVLVEGSRVPASLLAALGFERPAKALALLESVSLELPMEVVVLVVLVFSFQFPFFSGGVAGFGRSFGRPCSWIRLGGCSTG